MDENENDHERMIAVPFVDNKGPNAFIFSPVLPKTIRHRNGGARKIVQKGIRLMTGFYRPYEPFPPLPPSPWGGTPVAARPGVPVPQANSDHAPVSQRLRLAV